MIENICIAILGVSALVFLGYLVGLFSSKFDLRPRVERRFLLPESEDEARARYRAAWQKYRKLRVLLPITILGWIPYGVVLIAVFEAFDLLGNAWAVIWAILALVWVSFISIVSWQWAFWKCPRCGQRFKWGGDLFFPKHCHYCNLPMWAESPDE